MSRRVAWVVTLMLMGAAVALIAVEIGMGGINAGKAGLKDPCTTKPQLDEGGFFGSIDAAVQRVALSGLNGAACSLHTSREELVLSFSPALGTKKVRWSKETIRKSATRRDRQGDSRPGRTAASSATRSRSCCGRRWPTRSRTSSAS